MVDKNIVYDVFDDYLIKNVNKTEIKYARFKTRFGLKIRTQLRTTIWKWYNMLSGRHLRRRSVCHSRGYLLRQSGCHLKRHWDVIRWSHSGRHSERHSGHHVGRHLWQHMGRHSGRHSGSHSGHHLRRHSRRYLRRYLGHHLGRFSGRHSSRC